LSSRTEIAQLQQQRCPALFNFRPMKHNVLPALIIAAALLACGFFVRQAVTTSAAIQFDALLSKFEETSQKKADGADSRITSAVKGFSHSVAEGFKSAMNDSKDQEKRTEAELKVRDALTFREVKLVSSQQKSQERVIGLVKNGSDGPLNNIQLSILYKDKDGGLLDVGSGYVRGLLRPGEEAGFEANRSLGDYNEKEDVLARRRAASVVVSVSGFSK
jgi:hypothetical protein